MGRPRDWVALSFFVYNQGLIWPAVARRAGDATLLLPCIPEVAPCRSHPKRLRTPFIPGPQGTLEESQIASPRDVPSNAPASGWILFPGHSVSSLAFERDVLASGAGNMQGPSDLSRIEISSGRNKKFLHRAGKIRRICGSALYDFGYNSFEAALTRPFWPGNVLAGVY